MSDFSCINNESTDPPIEQSGDKGAQSVVDGGSVGPTVAPIVTRRRASLNLSQQENVPQDTDHAQGAIRQNIDAQKQPKKREKRANTTSPLDDDDFVDGAPRRDSDLNVVARDDTRAETDDAFPTVHTRTSPAIFVKAVSGLSEDQKRAVRELGFGCLLDLTITATPTKMGYWLVDNFNHMDWKLQLYDVGKIHVKEDDVYSVLGLPRGTIETCDRSDDRFKRHFVVLVVTCLFESSQNAVANLRTIHLLDDLSNVSKMNWCAYLIRCLVGAKKSWNANQKRKNFTGPLLFLTLFYVDKVVLSIRTVAGSLPIFKSWNNGLLKARERDEIAAGAFGRGYVDDDVRVSDARHRAEIHDGSPSGNDMNCASKLDVQAFMREFASKTRVLATAGIEVIKLVENAPRDLLGDENFTKMQGAEQKLLGICNEDSKGKGKQHMPSQPSQHAATCPDESSFKAPTQIVDDDFWNNPENLATLDAIVDAVARRDCFKRIKMMRMHNEGPSYNLGLGLSSDEEDDAADINRCHTTVDEVAVGEPSSVHVPSADCDAVVNESIVDTDHDCVQGVDGDVMVDTGVADGGAVDVEPLAVVGAEGASCPAMKDVGERVARRRQGELRRNRGETDLGLVNFAWWKGGAERELEWRGCRRGRR
ncbi:Unknown protein [Striga hermonthica]|uniref:Uncharacterized protein n=1 Tax=Striga hermonthica TaxID=68872 RepID=A0A9N7P1X4_STRHE|nr:Unknown protein [Striga hermonthica]